MKKAAVPAAAALSAAYLLFASGCGGVPPGSKSGTTGTTAGSTTGQVVTDNPRGIVTWSQIQGKSNVAATMRVNDSGTTVTQIPCEILSAQVETVNLEGTQENNVQVLYCQPGNSRGVFSGDSGSPVLVNGSIAGGLFGSSDSVHFDARGIQQEMAAQSGPPIARGTTPTQRITPQWYFEGSPAVYNLIKQHPGFENIKYQPMPTATSRQISQNPTIIPGLRFASPFVYGPYAIGYDAATYTYQLSSGNWVGTAHGLEDAGAVSWPVMPFYVDGFSNGSVSGHLVGTKYGTLFYDGQKGSVINPNTPAATMPVVVNTTLNLLPRTAVTHQVRFDMGSSTERQGIEAAAQGTLNAQLQGSSNSITASGSLVIDFGGSSRTFSLTFPTGETQTNFLTTLGNQIDADLRSVHSSAPNTQISHVTVTLNVSG